MGKSFENILIGALAGFALLLTASFASQRKSRLQTKRIHRSRHRNEDWTSSREDNGHESLKDIHSLLDILERDVLPLSCTAIGFGPKNKVSYSTQYDTVSCINPLFP